MRITAQISFQVIALEKKKKEDPLVLAAAEARKQKLAEEEAKLEIDAAVAALNVAEECDRIQREWQAAERLREIEEENQKMREEEVSHATLLCLMSSQYNICLHTCALRMIPEITISLCTLPLNILKGCFYENAGQKIC